MLRCLWQITWTALLLLLVLKIGDGRQFSIKPELPQRIVILVNETSSISIQDIPNWALFSVIQLHTQRYNLSVSSAPTFNRTSTKTGTSVGLMTLFEHSPEQFIWYVRANSTHNLTAVVYVQLYSQDDPIPGGCNQVFSLEIDPSIVVTPSSYSTHVWFQWSNLGSPKGQPLPDCENTTVINALSYDIYVSFVQQGDFTEEAYLSNIEGMLNPKDITNNGFKVFSVKDTPSSKSQVTVTSETSQGALYAIVVTSQNNRQAAYVTTVTYACDFEKNNCSADSSAVEIVFAVALCCCGLFFFVVGHRYFKIMLFIFGFIFASLLAYILLTVTTTLDDILKLSISMALGLVGGSIWVSYWYFCAFPIISVMVPGMCAGYLVASVLFFTPFGNIWWWNTSLNYGIAFFCALLIFTVFLMAYQKVLSILSCGIVGAYMFIMCIAIPLRSSLRLVFLNSLYHQTVAGYVTVLVVAPFHDQDIALAVLWLLLIITGVTVQFYRSRNQPPFEIPERHRRLRVQGQVSRRFSGRDEEINNDNSDERAGLLARNVNLNTRIFESYQSIPSSNIRQTSGDQ